MNETERTGGEDEREVRPGVVAASEVGAEREVDDGDEEEVVPGADELLRRMDAGRGRLAAIVEGVDERMLLEPLFPNGWSRRDLLAHLGAWERRIAGIFEALRDGSEPDRRLDESETDALNARFAREWSELSAPQVVRAESAAFQQVRSLVEHAAHEELFEPHRFAWTRDDGPFYRWIIGNTYGHLDEHLEDLPATGDARLAAR